MLMEERNQKFQPRWLDAGKVLLLMVMGLFISSCETIYEEVPCECPKHWHDRENDCLPVAEQIPVPETPVYYKSGFN